MHDQTLTSDLEHWFQACARDLPWRLELRDPYHSLVSEFMLQQTQVSRVLEKYTPFIERFPTVDTLASASEDDVLTMWAGLGYYRRARMLHACAQAIVNEHAGVVPSDTNALESLPGIGRYTAGAIASMVFKQRAPIVDGNVTRVLLRLHNKPVPQTDKDTVSWAWERANELVQKCRQPEVFNEAMMELGATCCTPKNIQCDQCPIQNQCESYREGTTESIPIPKPRAKQKKLYCACLVSVIDGSILIEQRPSAGMWSNMYQVPVIEREDRSSTLEELIELFELEKLELDKKQLTGENIHSLSVQELGSFTHITTHRIIEFVVYQANGLASDEKRTYRTIKSLDQIAISNAQRKVLTLAGILE